jgi:hypothetical protein
MAEEAGVTPLQFLVSVMLEPDHQMGTRLDAAKCAAPYMHRRMPQAIELPASLTPQFDIAKLLQLPASEREVLLATLRKLGVAVGDGPISMAPAPQPFGSVVVPKPGKSVAQMDEADAAGRPAPAPLLRAQMRKSREAKAAVAEAGSRVSSTHEPLPPKPARPKPPPKPRGRPPKARPS